MVEAVTLMEQCCGMEKPGQMANPQVRGYNSKITFQYTSGSVQKALSSTQKSSVMIHRSTLALFS